MSAPLYSSFPCGVRHLLRFATTVRNSETALVSDAPRAGVRHLTGRCQAPHGQVSVSPAGWCQTPTRAGVRLQLGGCQTAVEHTCNYGADRNCRITIPGVPLLSQTRRFRRKGDTENYQKTPCLLFSGFSVFSAAGKLFGKRQTRQDCDQFSSI